MLVLVMVLVLVVMVLVVIVLVVLVPVLLRPRSSYPSCFYLLLLRYEDQSVADGAPKSFASLADRFIGKGLDPAPRPLAENVITIKLRARLGQVCSSSPSSLSSFPSPSSQAAPPRGRSAPRHVTPHQLDAPGNISSQFCQIDQKIFFILAVKTSNLLKKYLLF